MLYSACSNSAGLTVSIILSPMAGVGAYVSVMPVANVVSIHAHISLVGVII